MLILAMSATRCGFREMITKKRTPRVGDRVAIPGHAVLFIVKAVNEVKKTVDVKMSLTPEHVEENISWEVITILDP
jgi:hypothetical protein